jgi:putative transposase
MSRLVDVLPEDEILRLPRPLAKHIHPEARRKVYEARRDALQAVLGGSSVATAGSLYQVTRTCLSEMIEAALDLAPDGKPHGFRVCIPYYRSGLATAAPASVGPIEAGPHSFGRLLATHDSVEKLIGNFSGLLPKHNAPSPKFDAFFKKFKKELERLGLGDAYPLSSPDKGRRAVIECIKRLRKHALCEATNAQGEDAETEEITKLSQIFGLAPLDRAEADGHKIDVEWHARVPTLDGGFTIVPVSRIWLLGMIDDISRVVYGVTLVIGLAYSHFDILELHAKVLTPWVPRELVVPNLAYAPGSWMPQASSSIVFRPVSEAQDNAMAHHALRARDNVARKFLGVLNLGRPHLPEDRPNIEAFFKILEERLLRKIPGGFRPGDSRTDPVATTPHNSASHPIDIVALEDLLDVWVSAYNVTPHLGLQNRTPREVFEAHTQTGLWTTQSSLTADDAAGLMTIHIKVTIRGAKASRKLPHVSWEHGTYRSPKLYGRWDLIGTQFDAIVNLGEMRTMTLLDPRTATPFVVLHVLAPYAASPHDYHMRRRVAQWRDRAGTKHDVGDDAVAAYMAYVRSNAAEMRWAADAFVGHTRGSSIGSGVASPPTPREVVAPLQPRTSVNLFKDRS